MMSGLMRLAAIAVLVGAVSAHVRLTWPPARKFAFDFLDNLRTQPPCGMPSSDDGPVTTFSPGQKVNVTWHLAYAHSGGYKLFIIPRNDSTIVANLTQPGLMWVGTAATTTIMHEVEIPADMQGDYTLVLNRNAAEWITGEPGIPYTFHSCADITISAGAVCNTNMDCSGNGNCVDNKCDCDNLASGDFCQYVDDCINEGGCSSNGVCTEVSDVSYTYPRFVCFCNEGFFGRNCEKANPADFKVDNTAEELETYSYRMLSESLEVYYKIYPESNEFEVIVQSMGESWVGIGWRPQGLNSLCRNFPVTYGTGEAAVPVPEADAITSAPTANPGGRRRRSVRSIRTLRDTSTMEGDDEQEDECIPRSGPAAEPGAEAEPGASAEPGAEPGASAEPGAEPGASAEPGAEPGASAEPGAEPGTSAEPRAEPGTSAEPEAEPGASAEPGAEPGASGEPEGEPEGPAGSLHAMDCIDVVIGMVDEDRSRVADHYTRDRSTPRYDTFYGGLESLVAAGGKQYPDRTVIKFRRSLTSNEASDHSIANGPMHVIFARGQEYGKYVHSPASGIEQCTANQRFYKRFELKYHGTHADQRGQVSNFNFYEDSRPKVPLTGPCTGAYSEPANCMGDSCTYTITWTFNEMTDKIRFIIKAKTDVDKWTGVGFSKNAQMVNSDAVIAFVKANGEVAIEDRYLGGKSEQTVIVDTINNLEDVKGSYDGGIMTMEFTRARNTGDDSQDVAFTDDTNGCLNFLIPTNGGLFTEEGNMNVIKYHSGTPGITGKMCIKKCGPQITDSDGPGGTGHGLTACVSTVIATIVMAVVTMGL